MLITRTPLFFGYSLEDPDIAQIQEIVRRRLGKFERMSYVVQFDQPPEEVERKLDDHVHVTNIRAGAGRDPGRGVGDSVSEDPEGVGRPYGRETAS